MILSTPDAAHAPAIQIERSRTQIFEGYRFGNFINSDNAHGALRGDAGARIDVATSKDRGWRGRFIINDERKLEGDIKITFAAVCAIIDELLGGMDSRGNELYNLGTSAMRNGQFDTAIDYFEQAIEIFELSDNVEKIALCEDKIAACHTYIAAQALRDAADIWQIN
ncbi:MAG: tetratricopeptide repeat protein, partial [Chloroflexia bacterium]|nr:tetratricopeptide repeat protein [Chloroflexia bacterium]